MKNMLKPKKSNVSASHGSVALGERAHDNNITVNSIQDIKEAMRQINAEAESEEVIALQDRLGVTNNALKTFFAIIHRKKMSDDNLLEKLIEIGQQYNTALDKLAVLEGNSPEFQKEIAKVSESIKMGEFSSARDILCQVSNAELAAAKRANELRKSMKDTEDKHYLNSASSRAEIGRLYLIEFDFKKAAEEFRSAAEVVPGNCQAQHYSYLNQCAIALQCHGEHQGDCDALKDAIGVFHQLLKISANNALLWADTQNNLGNTLRVIGEQETGTINLRKAVEAFNAALKVPIYDRYPVRWAKFQLNLANALSEVGAREKAPPLIDNAVTIYNSITKILTIEKFPTDWAMIQSNKGNALSNLGGKINLYKAERAHRCALKIITRDKMPREWIISKNNLGEVLLTLGASEQGTANLCKAVTIFQEVLGSSYLDHAAIYKAGIQKNLDKTIQTLEGRNNEI